LDQVVKSNVQNGGLRETSGPFYLAFNNLEAPPNTSSRCTFKLNLVDNFEFDNFGKFQYR